MSETDFPAESFSSGATADETPLEMALRLALEDGAYRKAFYQELLRTPLVVITAVGEDVDHEHRAAEPDEEFGIVLFGEGVVPVFSARERIFDEGGGTDTRGVRSMTMDGRALLEATRGNTLLLNPYSAHTITLAPPDVERLLDGSALSSAPQLWAVKPGESIAIRIPAVPPAAVVDGMSQFFRRRAAVRRAYLVWAKSPTEGEAFHLLIGVEAEGESAGLLRESIATIMPLLEAGENASFHMMNEGSNPTLADFLRDHIEPFYERGND